MTWGWSPRNEPLETGGALGTPAEARVPEAWPDYEADYLKHRLKTRQGRFEDPGLSNISKHIYLDNVSKNYKEEAEACLKKEFNDWLQGQHVDNIERRPYINKGTKPRRRHVFGGAGNSKTGDVMGVLQADDSLLTDWRPTNWGNAQLTHLPGVREYLREMAEHQDKAELDMNLLAEHGPQNLQEAWMYFKHWVKGRPVDVDTCMSNPHPEMGVRSDFGHQRPITEYDKPPKPAAPVTRGTRTKKRENTPRRVSFEDGSVLPSQLNFNTPIQQKYDEVNREIAEDFVTPRNERFAEINKDLQDYSRVRTREDAEKALEAVEAEMASLEAVASLRKEVSERKLSAEKRSIESEYTPHGTNMSVYTDYEPPAPAPPQTTPPRLFDEIEPSPRLFDLMTSEADLLRQNSKL